MSCGNHSWVLVCIAKVTTASPVDTLAVRESNCGMSDFRDGSSPIGQASTRRRLAFQKLAQPLVRPTRSRALWHNEYIFVETNN
jgi:hypothetical protein